MTDGFLVLDLVLGAVAVLAAVGLPGARARAVVAGGLTVLTGAAGVVAGAAALSGTASAPLRIGTALPGIELAFQPDRLGGLFLLLVSGVGVLAAASGIASAHGPSGSRSGWAAFALFLLGMQAVPAASDAASFLFGWELMAAASTALVLAEHAQRATVGRAALWYAVMSQASFALILAGFGVLAGKSGATSFASFAAVDQHSAAASWAFCLLTAGFGIKMGLVPLHVWLPRAHPEAPAHVSAAMSAAMVKLGAYGIALTIVRLLPHGPAWWGAVLLALGALSAGYGILRASVTSDLKVLLAYSTSENLGLIALALGASELLQAAGQPQIAAAALLAALLLCVSHAAFKAALFLTAGSVLHGTGERDLDRLGGLQARMPQTALAFGAAAFGAAALPASSGFIAEWVLLQSLVHATPADGRAPIIDVVLFPVAVGVVALTAGLSVLTFVKAYGIAFLGRPRSPAAADAHEPPLLERIVPLVAAALVFALGLVPGAVASALGPITTGTTGGAHPSEVIGVTLPGLDARLTPLWVLALAAAALVPAVIATVVSARRAPARSTALPWGSGGVLTGARMQYTATSFTEPALRVFDDVLAPTRDVAVTHAAESAYLVERVRVDVSTEDIVERRLYRPLTRLLDGLGVRARGIQNGSIHRYLVYSFAAVAVVLVVVAAIR
ncbi:MAG TPA: proton-conducting transporter membrane subunit [Gryllotalpicola sp.]